MVHRARDVKGKRRSLIHIYDKATLIHESEQQVAKIDKKYKRGFITDDERYRLTVAEWESTTKKVTAKLQENMREQRFNPIPMMADSGARG